MDYRLGSGPGDSDEMQRPVHLIGITSDITQRKAAERALGDSAERYRFLAEAIPQFVWTADETGTIDYANTHFVQYTGLTLDDLTRQLLSVVHPDDRERVRQSIDDCNKEGASCELEYRIRRAADGAYRWHLARSRMFRMPRGRRKWVGTGVDVHNLREAQEALRQSEEWQRIAVRAGNVGLWDWDIRSDHVEWSDRVYEIHGIAPGTFGGTVQNFVDLIYPDDAVVVREALERALSGGGSYTAEFRTFVEGELRWLVTESKAFFDHGGSPVRMLGAVIDNTERKRYEQALQVANKELRRANSNLEEFAYAAAHDLHEPLRIVSLYTQLLARKYGPILDGEAHQFIETARGSAERMQNLIEDLLAYTRLAYEDQKGAAEPFPVDGIVADVSANLRGAIEAANGTILTIPPLPVLCGRRMRVVQLMQNLIANALKYRRPDVPPRIAIRSFQLNGELVFEVEDNGIGVPPQYHDRIFGLFKRLHGRDIEGTGIGLALCRRIAEQFGGRIWVESAANCMGSRFRFTLPEMEMIPAPKGPDAVGPESTASGISM